MGEGKQPLRWLSSQSTRSGRAKPGRCKPPHFVCNHHATLAYRAPRPCSRHRNDSARRKVPRLLALIKRQTSRKKSEISACTLYILQSLHCICRKHHKRSDTREQPLPCSARPKCRCGRPCESGDPRAKTSFASSRPPAPPQAGRSRAP